MADEQGRQDKLLPGESSSMNSGDSDDAMHWVKVYAELVTFKDKLLDEVQRQKWKVGDEGQAEIKADEDLLRPEAARLRRRLDFWRSQLRSRPE